MEAKTLKSLKQGDWFLRKPEATVPYIREHLNPKDAFGPATICASRSDDIGRSIQLKPGTLVYPIYEGGGQIEKSKYSDEVSIKLW